MIARQGRHGSISRMLALVVTLAAASLVAAQAPDSASRAADRTARPADERITLAQVLEDQDARVSQLVGKRVVSPTGEDLGEVEDLLATDRDRPPTVIVSVGGVLDVGDKWYATSFDELLVASGGDSLVLDKTEDELANEPPFDYIPRAGESSHKPGVVSGPGTANSIAGLLGATVVDERGESIGEIDDLVVSSRERGIRAIVELAASAVPGDDERLVAISFSELHVEASGEEAAGLPQQPRVRANFEDTPIEALPAYEYSRREVI